MLHDPCQLKLNKENELKPRVHEQHDNMLAKREGNENSSRNAIDLGWVIAAVIIVVFLASVPSSTTTPVICSHLYSPNGVMPSTSIANNTPPVISSVSNISATRLQTILINGSGFGDTPPQTVILDDGSVDTVYSNTTPSMTVADSGGSGHYWIAGWKTTDGPGIFLVSWSNTEIVLYGFGTGVGVNGSGSWNIAPGDPITVNIWTISGHASFNTRVGNTTPTCCGPQWYTLQSSEKVWLVSQLIITLSLIFMVIFFYAQAVRHRLLISQKHFHLCLGTFVLFNTITQTLWTADKFYIDLYLQQAAPTPTGSAIFSFVIPFMGTGSFIPFLALMFLWSFVPVCWSSEKYARNSKRKSATLINLISAVALSIFIASIPLFFPEVADGAIPKNASIYETLAFVSYGIMLLSAIGIILFLFLIIGFYVAIAAKSSGALRTKSLFISFGFIFVFVGLGLTQVRVVGWLILISPVTVILGLIMLAAGYRTVSNFRQITNAMLDYYQSKHICVVHKGVIKTKIFMCGYCHTFYCVECKNALVALENKCWNCGEMLSRGRELPVDELVPSVTTTNLDENAENPEILAGALEKEPKEGPTKGKVATPEGVKAHKKGQ